MIITGNVGGDLELFNDKNGNQFATFRVAVRAGKDKTGKDKTEWVYVNCYGAEIDFAKKYIRKGDKVLVRGEPSVQLHYAVTGKTFANQRMSAEHIELLATKPDDFSKITDEYDYE